MDRQALEPVWTTMSSELASIEHTLCDTDLPDHLRIQLHLARMGLCCFGLQLGTSAGFMAQAASQLYTSVIHAIDLAKQRRLTDWEHYPVSIMRGLYSAAVSMPMMTAIGS